LIYIAVPFQETAMFSRRSPVRIPVTLLAIVLCTFPLAGPLAAAPEAPEGGNGLPNPILFVAQFPIAGDFATIGSTFGNHGSSMDQVGRGGDLYLLRPDGTLRNLTREAGFGTAATMQGATAISVRDPHVHWTGTKALFSMVIGAPTAQFQQIQKYWQMYEVTGFGVGQTAVITKIANQPLDYNNITPVYSPDGRIIFTTDRPRSGQRHHWPQHDEYESTATVSGLWSLNPTNGNLKILNHSPSGAFTPSIDSAGRLVFTRWDHLQRDQQADSPGNPYGNFDWASEAENAPMGAPFENFPESRADDPVAGIYGHRFNLFQPWMMHPSGEDEETLNHIGRHELQSYFNGSSMTDPNIDEFIDDNSGRFNPNPIENFFQMAEDPTNLGTFFGTDAPEFGTHAAGQIVKMNAGVGVAADAILVAYVTHPDTGTVTNAPSPNHSGHYRDPRPMSNGSVIVSNTTETREEANEGTRAFPNPRYDFRLKRLQAAGGGFLAAGPNLVSAGGIVRNIQYWDPDVLVTYNGPLWEMQPVEVVARPMPPTLSSVLPGPEAAIFAQENVDPATFKANLASRNLALTVSRDVTTRDAADRQQPFNLRVPGGVQTIGASGTIYDVKHMQFFQGDAVRGIGGQADPRSGRRTIAREMHDPEARNPPLVGAPPGSVAVAADGSMAALVPAHRAMTWQLTSPAGVPVVRERYWLTFQPGEIRVCTSCHGLNSEDQAGDAVPINSPEALRTLLRFWKFDQDGGMFRDGFETGNTANWSSTVGN
jgi:hypothetical protein